MTEHGVVSLGIAAAIGPELAGVLAPVVEEAGFHALWVNDTPGADALAVLEAAAQTTRHLTLATGVIPVDRRPHGPLAAQVNAGGLPQDRLVLGIGSGQTTTGALRLVSDAASALRRSLAARVLVGALGPKMIRLAVDESDGVLLSWLTPAIAREQADAAHASAPQTHVALYVRTALDPAAQSRLHTETARYAGYPAYAANFARHGMPALETVLDAAVRPVSLQLEEYRNGVDEVILRAITAHDTLDDYLRFIDDARALL